MMLNKNALESFIMDSENFNEVLTMVHDINAWNGSLDFLEYEINDEDFFNIYFESNPDEAVRCVCYGNYKYMDEYVKFNAYGNLESADEYEVQQEIKTYCEEIIEAIEKMVREGHEDSISYMDNFLVDENDEEFEEHTWKGNKFLVKENDNNFIVIVDNDIYELDSLTDVNDFIRYYNC